MAKLIFSQPGWLLRLRAFSRRLWIRASLFCLLAIATALLAIVLRPYVPDDLAISIGGDAVDNILSIIASSMLAVTTFSLSTMVAAYSSASDAASPRASALLVEDRYAHTALSTFIGAFLFSVVGLIALSTNFYGDEGRVVLFIVTLFVLAAVVATLIRWIDSLSTLGRVRQTIERVEDEARNAVLARARAPYLGGEPYKTPPVEAEAVWADNVGYVQSVNMGALARIAEDCGVAIYLEVEPGSFVHTRRKLAHVLGDTSEDVANRIRSAFSVEDSRSFDADIRFGLIVLSEVAQRALSPAVNDPGTAIDVIGVQLRLLILWDEKRAEEPEITCNGVFARPPLAADLIADAFGLIARDGASSVEIGIRLQKAFAALEALGTPDLTEAARVQAAIALERARRALPIPHDVELVEAAAPPG